MVLPTMSSVESTSAILPLGVVLQPINSRSFVLQAIALASGTSAFLMVYVSSSIDLACVGAPLMVQVLPSGEFALKYSLNLGGSFMVISLDKLVCSVSFVASSLGDSHLVAICNSRTPDVESISPTFRQVLSSFMLHIASVTEVFTASSAVAFVFTYPPLVVPYVATVP